MCQKAAKLNMIHEADVRAASLNGQKIAQRPIPALQRQWLNSGDKNKEDIA
jgi:hypothetical protein